MRRQDVKILMAILVYLFVLVAAYSVPERDVEDFTDTGVGCVDDCLEPMKGIE